MQYPARARVAGGLLDRGWIADSFQQTSLAVRPNAGFCTPCERRSSDADRRQVAAWTGVIRWPVSARTGPGIAPVLYVSPNVLAAGRRIDRLHPRRHPPRLDPRPLAPRRRRRTRARALARRTRGRRRAAAASPAWNWDNPDRVDVERGSRCADYGARKVPFLV